MNAKLPTISILEDDLFYADFLRHGLKAIHYPFVKNYYTKEQFLEAYKKERSDLILLDYHLHNTTGVDVLEAIKEINENAKVVIISAQENPKIALKILKKDVVDYLEKDQNVFKNLKQIILQIRKEKAVKEEQKRFKYNLITFFLFTSGMAALITYLLFK